MRSIMRRSCVPLIAMNPSSRTLTIASRASATRIAFRPSIATAFTSGSYKHGSIRKVHTDHASQPAFRSARNTFKWIWRLTYVSMAGLVGYTACVIYLDQNPQSQFEPDPSKKTLVILGTGWGSIALLKNLDTENYNVIVISPRNYFLFTPLLPSCTTGQVEHRSIMEPVRAILRQKRTAVKFYEAEASTIDPDRQVVKVFDSSEIKGATFETEVSYDMLVVGVGAENATFNIPGVEEHSCFLKEIGDAQQIRKEIMDCIETASFKGQSQEEINRLMHMVIVGGGPTGVELAAELQDFFEEDIKKLLPADISSRFKISLIEALPNVLPSFSKSLVEYTENTFRDGKIDVMTDTMVKRVTESAVEAQVVSRGGDGTRENIEIPYGVLVWATGNTMRPIIRDLLTQIPAQKDSRRGLAVDEYLTVQGTGNIWAVGDCAVAGYAPTAQVAAQEGKYLAQLFNSLAQTEATRAKLPEEIRDLSLLQERGTDASEVEASHKVLQGSEAFKPFSYSHQGSLAYIGSDKAVADVVWLNNNLATAGNLTYWFWRSAYLSMCFSTRNRILVMLDWFKSKAFGRDVSRE